ncbi:MAG: CPBP family intramembrane glutamic endopeptidase [Terracidiphilus sp.]
MERQLDSRTPDAPREEPRGGALASVEDEASTPAHEHEHNLSWVLIGDHGLRSGWSAVLAIALYFLLTPVLDTVAVTAFPRLAEAVFSPFTVLISELIPVVEILGIGLFMARIEHRRIADYNLADSRRLQHFAGGVFAGFAALSALVAGLAAGGWIRFGHASLGSGQAFAFGAVWAAAFLLVGLFEEGSFRCYLLFTLTRGISFWWALAGVSGLCLLLLTGRDPRGSGGVYLIALLGVVPCWLLHRARAADSGFWQAAWTTSTAFGYFHTSNNGENAVGIFAAALIGFVFCVSVRATGSAWWAIGCHGAWDWAETYFYGTPDSGFVAQRHFLTTTPVGNTLWSGGADGPEGSLLVAPVILLLLALLLVVYRRKRDAVVAVLP